MEFMSRGKLLEGVGLLFLADKNPLCEGKASTDLSHKAPTYSTRKARGVGDH